MAKPDRTKKEQKMKISKIILALAGIMLLGGAHALTTEEIMARCDMSSETVWDSYNNTCIPNNPCEKDGFDAYCVRHFAKARFFSWLDARSFINAYARYTDGQKSTTCQPVDEKYVGCTYGNGHYVVFEFDCLSTPLRDGEFLPESVTHFYSKNADEKGCYGNANVAGHMASHNLFPDLCILDREKDAEEIRFTGCTGNYAINSTDALNSAVLLASMHNIACRW